jgi:glycosyltransferase involved in cell wall biosynthesis
MKILQIVTQMEAGGAQRVAYLLHTELRSRGHESELCFLYQKRPAYARTADLFPLLDSSPSLVGYGQIILNLIRLVHREKPDAIITHTHYANVLGQAIAWLMNVRIRISVHHNPVDTYPRAARRADRILGAIGVYSDSVAVSRTVAASMDKYARSYRDRLHVVYNGTPAAHRPSPRPLVRKRWNIPENAPLLVHVGRLSRQKNQEFLLRLLPKNPALHLLLVGDGELGAPLHSLAGEYGIGERVHFTGEVSPEEVSSLVASADIFVFPSLFEAVGMVMLEAMLLGVPVISSDIPSSREFLSGDGLLVDTAKSEKWLEAIDSLLRSPAYASAMADRAKERARRFTVARMADGYEQIIEAIDEPRFAPSPES